MADGVSPERLASLFDAHAAALVLYARSWCETPEDVVQDAFLALSKQRREPERVVPWLYRCVRNGAVGASRRAGRLRRRERAAARAESWFARTDDGLDARDALRLLAELPPESREILTARLWGGLTFEEIAEVHGSSAATAHRRYHAALAALQERLDPRCTSPTNR
jgi:RNA polymerase sigma-70 factor (ECF subfamily)